MSGRASTEAASRDGMAAAFLFVHDLLRAPGPEQWSFLTGEATRASYESLARDLGLPESMDLPRSAAEYESSYIEAFDAGAPHPPVPLQELHYNRREPVPRILHENILFFQSFGLRLRQSANETADHLRHQIEFVAWLYRMEANELAAGRNAEKIAQIRSARRDYIERHLASWVPAAAGNAAMAPTPWVRSLLAMVERLVQAAAAEF